jgi:hypothetical protein
LAYQGHKVGIKIGDGTKEKISRNTCPLMDTDGFQTNMGMMPSSTKSEESNPRRRLGFIYQDPSRSGTRDQEILF